MKHLTLLRHAKAARGDPSLDDFDRQLNETGRSDAPKIAAYMKAHGIAPDGVLCSPSRRTRETLDLIRPAIAPGACAQYPERLYHAPPQAILASIAAAPDGAAHLLVVGHNPGLHALAANLIDFATSDAQMATRLSEEFPTCALAHFELNIGRWAEIAGARGALRHFATPKGLAGGDGR